MKSILLDTNAYSSLKRGELGAIEIVNSADSVFLNTSVRGELLSGFAVGSRAAENVRELDEFLHLPGIKVLDISRETARAYALIYSDLRKRGTPIPTNDLWIAATALQFDSAVFSFDRHFVGLPRIRTGSSPDDFL